MSQPEFDERDAVVMRCAYASQNALGRLCEERVYENDLARRFRAEGFSSVHTQMPVTMTHDGFAKDYRLDLVADNAVYELKTVSAFVPEHDTQALHYAMLLDINHAKLLNFRPEKVRGRLRFNAFLADKRLAIQWDEHGWSCLSPQCDQLRLRLHDLMADWGACLEVRLYDEALIHFCGGEARCLHRPPVVLDDVELGNHIFQLHAEGLGFLGTAFNSALDVHRVHIARLLALTGLRALQWINFNRTSVRLTTIQADNSGTRMRANE